MRSAVLTAAFLALPATASAQGLFQGWDSGQVTVYGWLPGITGAQEAPDGEPIVDLDGIDVLDALDFAFFGAGEIRRGRFGLLFDVEYADLSQDGTARGAIIPGADPASASVGTKLLMSTGVVTWRAYEQERGAFDLYGGVRAFNVEADFGVDIPAINFDLDREASVSWADLTVGMRGHADLGRRFGVTGLADAGGFGIGDSSNLTWQVTGTLDYAFTERVSGRIGYRYMSIDYESDELTMDIEMYGPLIGVTWAF
jgi:opacity protein-like surface antigen